MENISFFDTQEFSGETKKKLDVVKVDFDRQETVTWKALFDGFDELHAITYSSGIQFVCKLVEMFSKAEIIFGYEGVLGSDTSEIMAYQMAYQSQTIEKIKKTGAKIDLIKRIENNSLRLYIAGVLSHEKIYLLSADDGRKRVIMGSANMSFSAFGGNQRENICYFDGDKAYEWYMSCYESLRENSTQNITKEALICNDINSLPISQAVRQEKCIVIEPVSDDMKDDIQFSLNVHKLAKRYSSVTPKPDKNGKITLIPKKIDTMCKKIAEKRKDKPKIEPPELVVSVDDQTVSLNGTLLDLCPSDEEVQKDIALFIQYMDGFASFHGDTQAMQRRYYEFANWFFCTPFLAYLRDTAIRNNLKPYAYPVFGLIYGPSKAGKTSLLELLLRMMIGQSPKVPARNFTSSGIDALKRSIKGSPIIVDDLAKKRFTEHAIENIKYDDFGVDEHLIQYPAVVISANEDIKVVQQEIARRTVICRAECSLTNREAMCGKTVSAIQKNIGTAFYREYLKRMLVITAKLGKEIGSDESDIAPDAFAASSEVLYEMFAKFDQIPQYIRKLSFDDYFGEKVIGKHAIETISAAWRSSPEAFGVSQKTNELYYDIGDKWDARNIAQELPENVLLQQINTKIVMNLNEAQNFFGISFRKPFLQKLRK